MSEHQLSIPQKTLKTGVTTGYVTGDDATYKKGIKANPRWVDNGDGTISDRATGLTWIQDVGKMAVGTPGRLTKNQVQAFRGYWANATGYSIGDLSYDAINGLFYICFVAHTSRTGAPNWAPNGTYYPTGSNVFVPTTGGYYQSQADHYSISLPGDVSQGGYYNYGDFARDPLNGYYWQANFTGNASSAPSYWASSTYHNSGDIVVDPYGTNRYYQYTSYGTTISDPGSWSGGGTYYTPGQYIYISGYTGYGLADGYYYCNTYHYSTYSYNFYDDYSSGYWSSTGYTDLFQLDRATVGNWSDLGYNDWFTYERGINSWSNVATYDFAFELYVNPSYWSGVSNTFQFSDDRAAHPTYWEQTIWNASPYGVSAAQFPYATAIANCEALDYAGKTDWRLPNAEELLSLFDFSKSASPFIDTLNKNMQSNWWWTSSRYSPSPTDYVTVMYLYGALQITAGYRFSAYPCIPVRGG